MRTSRFLSVATFWLFLGAAVFAAPQKQTRAVELFQRLQNPETSGQAAAELVKLGKVDPETRQYLAKHLPMLIATNPQRRGIMRLEWYNAVQIAAELKLAEAVPALSKWIGLRNFGATGLSLDVSLQDSPAATALAQIGDPAIPTLQYILAKGDQYRRRQAVYVLCQINSSRAREASHEYVLHGQDRGLVGYSRGCQ